MILLWHLVKKDLHRLRLPLALFSLLLFGKIIFYAAIGGLFQAPDLGWLNRLQNVPELLLRALAEPLIVYFLVGWLVFEDSPVEKDAHWITRPISGGRLFAVKMTGAGLMFVVWPLMLNLLWWLACGFDWSEICMAAGESVATNSLLVALALTVATLTDGYPRFILWSVVSLIAFVVLQLIFNFTGSGFSNFGASRLLATGIIAGVSGLAVAGHQFVTRHHRNSLALACVGLLMVGIVSGAWRWDFVGNRPLRLRPDDSRYTGVTLKLTGPARYRATKGRPYVQLPMQIVGLPDAVAVAWISGRGEWTFAGRQVWTSRVDANSSDLWREAIHRRLGFKTALETGDKITLTLPISSLLAQRAKDESAAFHASLDLYLAHGKIAAELPLHEGTASVAARAYTLSFLSTRQLKEPRRSKTIQPAMAQNGVTLLLTERSAARGRSTSVLVSRRTGEIFLADPARSGPQAITVLNQAKVTCSRLTFLMGSTLVRLDDLTLAVIHFDEDELLARELNVDPVPWAFPAEPPQI
jgi:hypothetical protein